MQPKLIWILCPLFLASSLLALNQTAMILDVFHIGMLVAKQQRDKGTFLSTEYLPTDSNNQIFGIF